MSWPWLAPAAREMFSSMSVPPRSFTPAWRACGARRRAHLHPAGLDVRDPPAIGDAPHGVHEQRSRGTSGLGGPALEVDGRRHVHEGQGHELGEAARLALQVAGPHQVPGPGPGPLDGPEHDGDVGPQPDAVGGAVRLEPLFGVDLVGTQHGTDLVVEDLGRGAGQGGQPGFLEAPQVVDERLTEAPRPFGHLQGGEPVDVDALGDAGAHGADHVQVVVTVELRVDPTLEADLGGARPPRPRRTRSVMSSAPRGTACPAG